MKPQTSKRHFGLGTFGPASEVRRIDPATVVTDWHAMKPSLGKLDPSEGRC
jgi:hypothetical protein